MMNMAYKTVRQAATVLREEQGTMAIETALIAPVLLLMAVGSFQVSAMVARQSELQGAASEAALIGLANPPETDADLVPVKAVLMESTGLPAEKVTVRMAYRCGSHSDRTYDASECHDDETVSTYMTVYLRDTYTPIWTRLGVGSPVYLKVRRAVQVS